MPTPVCAPALELRQQAEARAAPEQHVGRDVGQPALDANDPSRTPNHCPGEPNVAERTRAQLWVESSDREPIRADCLATRNGLQPIRHLNKELPDALKLQLGLQAEVGAEYRRRLRLMAWLGLHIRWQKYSLRKVRRPIRPS